MKRCKAKHPMYPQQVRCEEPAGHDGSHFHSFYMRSWDDPECIDAGMSLGRMVATVQCEGCNVGGRWMDCDRTGEHGHGIEQDAYDAQRVRELQPLADALALVVRGATDARVEQTGGDVYCAVVTLADMTIYADEYGWSVNNEQGGIAVGGWYEDGHALEPDPDTDTLDPDECEAAAHTFAQALPQIVGA